MLDAKAFSEDLPVRLGLTLRGDPSGCYRVSSINLLDAKAVSEDFEPTDMIRCASFSC